MVVVKADGYGHGMVPVARAARSAGAEWLGVATGAEALALREAGATRAGCCPGWRPRGGLLAADRIRGRRDGLLGGPARRDRSDGQRHRTGRPVELKFDTGLSRGGAPGSEWPALVRAARAAEEDGTVRVTGLWSHLACSDEPEHPANAAQSAAFDEACALAADAGLDPEVRHLANSAGAILHPGTRHDLVRLGIAAYGLSPAPDVRTEDQLGLVPAMAVRGAVVLTKELAAGVGVSYGDTPS